MRIAELESRAQLETLRGEWDSLLRQSGADTIFLTWDWMAAWWDCYGSEGDLRIVTVRDESGVLQGVAPLQRRQVRRFGRTAETLAFAGDGSNDSEYLDFIVAPARAAETWGLFESWLEQQYAAGRIALLNEIPESSATLARLSPESPRGGVLYRRKQTACATVPLPAKWDAYLAMLKPRFRTKVRSVLRNLESRPEFHFGVCESESELSRLLPVLFDLHTRRWAADGKPGVFRWDRKREFYHDISTRLLPAGQLRITWLEWNGQILACQYGFLYNGIYFHLQEGYEPECEHWNCGIGLRAWSMRRLIGEGAREYDFLGGFNRHKADWAAVEKHSVNLEIASATLPNRVFCDGPQWRAAARESVARMLPERVLAWRRSMAAAPAPHRAIADGLRRAGAGLYVHSGFPALIRRVREQYQLAGPRISLQRRSEPAGRILYYHRVNDANDPFFPAISTALFEAEMRYLARYHKVVSLAELLRRLANGVPGDVVAITFDDGYQDNFTCALPILERYGLPATIFLTTGSIDSPEPIWFEHLAWQLKTANREWVDLDIGIPRRYPLATIGDRLEANEAVYGLLRQMPDGERRAWMHRIASSLGASGAEPGSPMLAWDQVRRMQQRGIDFGGHTVNHPFLSRLSPSEAWDEVSQCKRRIEEETQRPVLHFAYPSGRETDFAPCSKDVVRRAGYQAAVTTIWGMNYRTTDLMELRRGGPWESTLPLFASKFDWYQLTNG